MTRTRRYAAGVCATATMMLGVLTWAASPSAAQTAACPVSADDQAIDAEEQALLGLVNQYRQANGKNALAMNPSVTRAAAWFSRDMATKNYFPYDHVDADGRTLAQRLTWCSVSYANWAENIYAGSPDARTVFDAWRASSSHNVNMLRDGVTSAGIARAYGALSTYGWYWTLDLTDTAGATTTTTSPVSTTTTTAAPPTTTAPPPTATTTTAPTSAAAPGLPDWYSQWYAQFYGATTIAEPVDGPTTTTTTTAPPPPPTTTTTTVAPVIGPAPGTAESYWQWYWQYYTG